MTRHNWDGMDLPSKPRGAQFVKRGLSSSYPKLESAKMGYEWALVRQDIQPVAAGQKRTGLIDCHECPAGQGFYFPPYLIAEPAYPLTTQNIMY